MKVLPNLTPLRFILALLVVVFHVPQFCKNRGFPFFNDLPVFNKGTEAVYLFFALSGFLIIKQLYIEKNKTGTINLKKFYIRRSLRIFPLYFVVLFFGLIYYNYILPKMGFDFVSNYPLWEGIALSIFFLPNIFIKLYQPGGIIEVLWSIGIEEQFYLLIAPLLFFIRESKIILFLISFTLLYLILYFSGIIPELSEFSMYYFYFTFSGLISIISERVKLNTFFKWILSIVFLLYFLTNIFQFENQMYTHLFSMIFFGFFLQSISESPIYVIQNEALNYLGSISYGVYMYHVIVMQIVGFIYLKVPIHLDYYPKYILFLFLAVGLTIFISHLSFKYFESYFIRKKNSFRLSLN